jgi:polysaccharide pyruvyl transferase WcaK-like protein
MRNRVHFIPASQVENLGDQLINAALLEAFRHHAEVVINDLDAPRWFIDAIARPGDALFSSKEDGRFSLSLARQVLLERLRGDKVRNFVVLPPGHTSRHGARQARFALGRYARLLLLRVLGCRIVRVGFSIGPFDRLNAIVESVGSRAFTYYGLRDRESLALATRYRFHRPRYFPDLAWGAHGGRRPGPAAPEDGPVVLSFRSNAFGQVHSSDYLLPIRQRLRALLAIPQLARRQIVIAYQVEADREPSRELCDDLRASGLRVEFQTERMGLRQAAALYRGAACVLSNRLHVLLLAAQCGSLPIALVMAQDNAKITSILSDNDLEALAVRLDEEESAAAHSLQGILANRSRFLERLDRAAMENGRANEDAMALLFPASREMPGGRPRIEGDLR